MIALACVAALLGAGAIVTLIGSWLIERAHPPRGRWIGIGGLRQHLVDLASGAVADPSRPPIVLLHGAGCNLEDMRLALGTRLAAGHRVILIDRPGLGWSERQGRNADLPTYQAAMLRDVLDRLGTARAVLVGHSWGGALAATFALDQPERVAGLVLLAPPTHPRLRRLTLLYSLLGSPFAGWVFARTLALPLAGLALSAGLRAVFAPQKPPPHYVRRSAASLLLRPSVFLANAHDIAALQAFLTAQAPRYGELKVPTIVVSGDRDRIVPLREHAVPFAAAVPGAKLVVVPGMGHMLHHAAADRIVAAIEEMLSSSK